MSTSALTVIDEDFSFDPDVGIYWRGAEIHLAPAERHIVAMLVAAPGMPVTWDAMKARIGRRCSERSIKVMVSRIRAALAEVGADDPIQSNYGHGYCWSRRPIADVPDRSLGFWARCVPCGHSWIAAYFPAPLEELAEIARKAFCPKCGNRKPVVARQSGGKLTEEVRA